MRTNVKAVGVVLLELVKLGLGALSRQLNIRIRSIKALGQVHLQALGRSNGHLAASILPQKLGEHLQQHQVSKPRPAP